MIDQITVFLENDKGRLASLCRCVGDAGVNMAALSIADTTEYGLARVICSDSARAREALEEAGYRVLVTKVIAMAVPHRPGALADLLDHLDRLSVNIEYGYCFSHQDDDAIMAFKIAEPARAAEAAWTLEAAGYRVFGQDDLE